VSAEEENTQSVFELAVETVNKEPLSKHKLSLIHTSCHQHFNHFAQQLILKSIR
jgi:hypothetical protein